MIVNWKNTEKMVKAVEDRINKISSFNRFETFGVPTCEPHVSIETKDLGGGETCYTYSISGGLKETPTILEVNTLLIGDYDDSGNIEAATSMRMVTKLPKVQLPGIEYDTLEKLKELRDVSIPINGFSRDEFVNNDKLREFIGIIEHVVCFMYAGEGFLLSKRYTTFALYENIVGTIFNAVTEFWRYYGEPGFDMYYNQQLMFGTHTWYSKELDNRKLMMTVKFHTKKFHRNVYKIVGDTLTFEHDCDVFADIIHMASAPMVIYTTVSMMDVFFTETSIIK